MICPFLPRLKAPSHLPGFTLTLKLAGACKHQELPLESSWCRGHARAGARGIAEHMFVGLAVGFVFSSGIQLFHYCLCPMTCACRGGLWSSCLQ